ncbi:MAG: hypothetical protein V2J26_00695 [Pacificimonas sp.]|jgi:hypothetical protein|nr:hypothetical protein [Pacificimonas sp.]
MFKFSHPAVRALAFAGALAVSAPATAAVIFTADGEPQGSGDATFSGSGTDTGTVTFDWQNAPVTQFVDFTATTMFDLFFTSYQVGSGSQSDISAYTLDWLTAPGGPSRLTTQTTFCTSASQPVQGTAGECDLISFAGSTSGASFAEPDSGNAILAGLASGSYRLGFFDSSSPDDGTVTFQVRSEPAVEVPAPAMGLMLLVMGGVFAGLRRTR